MSIDTIGKIKGFVSHEAILDFIRQKWDKDARSDIKKDICQPISECNWKYKINEHSEDNENWYVISGFIVFKHNDDRRMLFYSYNNLNHLENLAFYSRCGLRDMVEAETTHLSLGCFGDSVQIMRELILHFGGGWIDENDCDNKEYHFIEPKSNENTEKDPVKKTVGFGIVLREKPCEFGLTKSDVIDLFDMLDDTEAFPIELMAKEHESVAMGFITPDASSKLEYDYENSGLNEFIANILDDMDNESDDCTYEFKGIKIWLSR